MLFKDTKEGQTHYIDENREIPGFVNHKVKKVTTHDCGLYRKYEQHILIDNPDLNLFEHHKIVIKQEEQIPLCLRVESFTIEIIDGIAYPVLVREIYEEVGEIEN